MVGAGTRRSFNLVGILTSFLLLGVAFFVLVALLSGNVFFATKRIVEKPYQVIVYYEGKTVFFEPGDPEYDRLVAAAYDAIADETGLAEWGWSEQRFESARNEGIAVEFMYLDPVKLPGNRLDIADAYRLFFPLEVFGWQGEVVFRGGDETYWGAPIRVKSLDPLRRAVDDITDDSL